MVGFSASTLSRIETGQRKLTDVAQLRLFCRALDIPHHLFGITPSTTPAFPDGAPAAPGALVPTTVGAALREGDDDAMRRRQVLAGLVGVTGAALLGGSGRLPGAHGEQPTQHLQPLLVGDPIRVLQPVGVQVLRDRLAGAHATFHAGRYHELAVALPEVIAAAQANLEVAVGLRREQVFALLADAYSLASSLCSKLRDDSLAWVTAERARSAAHASGDATCIAEAARMTSIAMRRHGHHDTATTLLTTTARKLGADSGDPTPELLTTYGSLLCTAAYTAAHNGDRHRAVDLIGEAETTAGRLGDARVPHTPFSPTNVAIYQIGVHTALGDAGTALDHARKINLRTIPTPERQARFCVDTARAWLRFGSRGNCYQALLAADRCAPEELRRLSVRSLVDSLLEAPGPTPSGLRAFAARCGAVT